MEERWGSSPTPPGVAAPAVQAAPPRITNTLPQMLLIVRKDVRQVLGAWMLSECAQLEGHAEHAYWRVERTVLLQHKYQLGQHDISRISALLNLKGPIQHAVRAAERQVGGPLGQHFPIGQAVWRAWPLDDAQLRAVQSHAGAPFTIVSPSHFSRAVGVVASIP